MFRQPKENYEEISVLNMIASLITNVGLINFGSNGFIFEIAAISTMTHRDALPKKAWKVCLLRPGICDAVCDVMAWVDRLVTFSTIYENSSKVEATSSI